MSRYSAQGTCDSCGAAFRYFLIDSRRNESAYAYCDRCGATGLLGGSGTGDAHGPVPARREDSLSPCSCGGRFRGTAAPRCPSCGGQLGGEPARSWIEANARGTGPGWRWQGSWSGPYCIVIENRVESIDPTG